MEYREHQLDNGFKILAECNDNAHVSAWGIFVRAGARDETDEINGVSHFLEHMVFKGTAKRSAEEVNLKLDEMGSHSNARTSESNTIYHASVLPEFQSDIVELLTDLMRPALRDDDFETEKQVIIEEIKMYADQPPYGGYEAVMKKFFGNHPLGKSVLGTEATVSQLTSRQMRDYFQRQYCPSNMAIAAAGKIDFERLVEQVETLCGDWQKSTPTRQLQTPEPHSGLHAIVRPNATQQYILQLAPGPSVQDEIRYATKVMAGILGDYGGSRLYWEFLDTGLADSAWMGIYPFDDCGALMTYLCCDPNEAPSNLERLRTVQQNVFADGITQKELDLAKRKIASRIVLAGERTEARMFSIGTLWLSHHPFMSLAQIAAIYESLTLDQINESVARFPLENNMTVVVGPRDDFDA